jgi:glutathione S-transferase
MFHLTALVTCLAVLFYFYTSIRVSRARVAFGIKVPAISGNADFERVFRVQMNTLEWMPVFLPSLWLLAIPSRQRSVSSGSPAVSST